MAKIPVHYADKPELVAALIEARIVQMKTEDTVFAIEWLMEHYPMSVSAAERVLEDETFQYVALYPEGHPGLDAIRAEQRAKGRRSYGLKKLRPQIIERDDSRCQNCNERVKGRNATIDHKDPEGPETLENLLLLCRKCNTLKGKRTWEDFQKATAEWRESVERSQRDRPDFICFNTGLSVKGRSWKEAGCESPSLCLIGQGCMAGFNSCPCLYWGCPPDCGGCGKCVAHNDKDKGVHPYRILCPVVSENRSEFGWDWDECDRVAECREIQACVKIKG